MSIDVSVHLLPGVKMPNPTMNASGCVGTTAATLMRLARHGAGALVTKSISLRANQGNPGPVIAEVTGGILNCIGGTNPGSEEYIEEIRHLKKEVNVPIVASVEASEGYEKAVSKAAAIGVEVLEMNISCAHRAHGVIGKDAITTEKATRISKEHADKIPVLMKLTPNVNDIAPIAKAAEDGGADGIVAINSVGPGMVIDIESGRPLLGGPGGRGGLTGPAVKPIAVRCVSEIARAVEIPVIGVGGISCGNDAIEMMMAGASAVQIGTALMYQGIDVFNSVTNEIAAFMKRKNYAKIRDIIGIALPHLR
jgi:dihydroorotate dehydrogenase (NAD+) catalytic subunit